MCGVLVDAFAVWSTVKKLRIKIKEQEDVTPEEEEDDNVSSFMTASSSLPILHRVPKILKILLIT